MAFNGLSLKYSLDGNSNYIAWKDLMEAVLEDNGLEDFIDQEVPKPVVVNGTELAERKKCVARARRILLGGVRDHIVSSLHGKETSFLMWKTLKDIYQNINNQRKLALKDKLRKIKCENGNTISKYLRKLTTCRDELGSVRIMTADDDMKKSKKGSSKGLDNEALASQFKLDLSLIIYMVSSMVGCVWYLDSGASFHMFGDKNLFSTLEEKDLQIQIEMGDDEKYRVLGEGTVVFQREHGAPLTLTDVKYVRGLKKNLVSIAMLEDKGYD
eukprot:PITA_12021